MPQAPRIKGKVLMGKCGLNAKGTPYRSAQRCMSWPIQRPLAGTVTGLALPVALNTPPSSIGRYTRCAPHSSANLGNWVLAK